MPPDAKRRPVDDDPDGAPNDSLGGGVDLKDRSKVKPAADCPMACGSSCPWRCPVPLSVAVEQVVAELARCANALQTISDAVVYERDGDLLVGRFTTAVGG